MSDERYPLKDWLKYCCKIYDYKVIGDYFIGSYDVIFGCRIRAGECHVDVCVIDLCMGDSATFLEQTKRLYANRMRFNKANKLPIFDGLPTSSDIKPCWKDEFWLSWFVNATVEEGWLEDAGNASKRKVVSNSK